MTSPSAKGTVSPERLSVTIHSPLSGVTVIWSSGRSSASEPLIASSAETVLQPPPELKTRSAEGRSRTISAEWRRTTMSSPSCRTSRRVGAAWPGKGAAQRARF
eukprot:scaffold17397_cov125-Isochrysis_galbana.AAC.5